MIVVYEDHNRTLVHYTMLITPYSHYYRGGGRLLGLDSSSRGLGFTV